MSSNSYNNQEMDQLKLNKIKRIIEAHFDEEINYKKLELETIDDRIFQAKNTLDKLRVCVICKFYSLDGQINQEDYKNHPAIRQLKCEHLELAATNHNTAVSSNENGLKENDFDLTNFKDINDSLLNSNSNDYSDKFQQVYKQFTLNLSVGNVSKYLKASAGIGSSSNENSQLDDSNLESSQYNQDLITHKWMIFIRSSNCPKIENYIKKVVFYLHSSYKPYDVVEIKTSPFQLIRKGWGEFPIHVQIHFKDPRNKRVDISHLLKLDWTQTGLQTFGGETDQEIQLTLKQNDFIPLNNATTSTTFTSTINKNIDETPKQEQIINEIKKVEPVEEPPKPVALPIPIKNSNVDDLLNLRPKLSNGLSQANLKTLPIILNENSAKIITSKFNLNKPGILSSIVTTKIPIKNQITLNDQISSKSSILNRLANIKPVLNENEKNQVIYKIESSDLNKNEPKITQSNSNIIKQQQQKTVEQVNHQSQITKVVPMNNNEQNKRKLNDTDLNEISTSNIDKKSKQVDEQEQQPPSLQTPINNQLIYSVDDLISKFNIEINTFNKKKNNKFEDWINKSIKYFPLVLNFNFDSSSTNKKQKHQLGFCAKTLQEYYLWPYAKRRANEWLRALHIKRFILENLDQDSKSLTSNVNIMSTKSIVLYLRSHGYTPLENQHIAANNNTKENNSTYHYVNSLTPIDRLLKKSKIPIDILNEKNVPASLETEVAVEEDDQILIDIMNDDAAAKNGRANKYNSKQSDLIIQNNELNYNNENMIEMCPGSKYVKEQLELLNIRTNSVNLVPNGETSSKTTNAYACNLVEKFMFAVCKRFADDLIRQTCADLYFSKPTNSQKLLSSNNRNNKKSNEIAADLILKQKFPTNLNVMNIFQTIKNHDRFDFLTNKYMANTTPTKENNNNNNNKHTNDSTEKQQLYNDQKCLKNSIISK